MKMKYISKITSNLKRYKSIRTNRVTSRVLDGSYRSVYKGRSMNFDELREYVAGDDIKDMDWKASARSQKLLVKQYVAEKKHNIMLVLDTNCRMLADTLEIQEKREVALMSAGTLAYLINQNGDYTGAIFPTKQSLKYYPFKTGLMNIENILENYHKHVTEDNVSSINTALEYIVRHFRRNMIIIIVTDIQGIHGISESILKRLMVMNDVLMINVSDTTMSLENGEKDPSSSVYSLEKRNYLSGFFTKDRELAELQERNRQKVHEECVSKLKRFGISFTTINHEEEMDQTIIALLSNK